VATAASVVPIKFIPILSTTFEIQHAWMVLAIYPGILFVINAENIF